MAGGRGRQSGQWTVAVAVSRRICFSLHFRRENQADRSITPEVPSAAASPSPFPTMTSHEDEGKHDESPSLAGMEEHVLADALT